MNFKFPITLAFVFCMILGGCRLYSRHRILEVWGDWNTCDELSMGVGTLNHLPYHAPEVARFNWMYGVKTYKPLVKQKKHSQAEESSQSPTLDDPWIPKTPSNSYEKQATPHRVDVPENNAENLAPGLSTAEVINEKDHPVQYAGSNDSEATDEESLLMQYPEGDLETISGSRPRHSFRR